MRLNPDEEIWERFKRGDEKAFSYIFDTYHLPLYEYGQRFTSDEFLVRDSIQDLFFELARKKDKLSSTDNILFYLLKSLRLKIFANLRKNNRKGETVLDDERLDEFRLSYTTEVDPEEKELRLDQLAQAINELPPRLKETIYLKFYKNLSNQEVAEVMQVNYQTVGNNVQKAINKLKELLDTTSESILLFFNSSFR
ncbi:DNA-directed RNA polymerase sigma-70 factor [Prolixibacter bellariivorans]|uniref:DNA-directed RNA polymerase sigma-70 factor n=1 Tax=Prolixibacter bellariivorans TaxID=314319 RepID=A0A5M4B4L8_9BACT|nr:sigma-70 family RNA polymerase sigma factor [Prolixibacter bellariivorans]GET34788.1 DNA-directed RNA polymerase sigma-70 factor [Prolixibacter bellariivorans]